MKTLAALLWLYCLSYMALGGIVRLEWDAQPGNSFHIWKGSELVSTVTTNQATIEVASEGPTPIKLTAFKPGGYGESAPLEATVYGWTFQTSNDLRAFTFAWTFYTLSPFIRWNL